MGKYEGNGLIRDGILGTFWRSEYLKHRIFSLLSYLGAYIKGSHSFKRPDTEDPLKLVS